MRPIELYQELLKTQKVTDLFTGDCKGCGECCSRFLPLSSHDIERIKVYTLEDSIEQREPQADIDMICPYLTDERLCAIYDARPDICRSYRCDLHAKGVLLGLCILPHHPYTLADLREVIK